MTMRASSRSDALNPVGPDTGFYVALAESAAHIADFGCGTGLPTCELARRGYRVTWIEGDAGALAFRSPARSICC